jgi:hypothetical protein
VVHQVLGGDPLPHESERFGTVHCDSFAGNSTDALHLMAGVKRQVGEAAL